MIELRETGQGYLKLLAGALALRAKASPTQQLSYEPLVDAMTQLALCLRNPNATLNELLLAIYLASDSWTEWHDNYTHFWERIETEHAAALERGDLLAQLLERVRT